MSKQFLVFLGAGLAAVAAIIGFTLYTTRGAHMELKGEILKVREIPLEQNSVLAVIDFRVSNPADYPYVVRTADVIVEKSGGGTADVMPVSKPDMDRVFEQAKLIGPKYNDILSIRDRIPPHQTVDRMVAARVELSEDAFAARKGLRLHIEEVDGVVTDINEKKKP